MQRLARYPLLLGQIIMFTESDNPDLNDLKAGLEAAQRVLNSTNEGLREQENEGRLQYLSETLVFPDDASIRLDLTAPTKYMGERKLLKEGPLVKGWAHKRSSKRKDLAAILFNDFLLFTTTAAPAGAGGAMERLSASVFSPASSTNGGIVVYHAVGHLSSRPARGSSTY